MFVAFKQYHKHINEKRRQLQSTKTDAIGYYMDMLSEKTAVGRKTLYKDTLMEEDQSEDEEEEGLKISRNGPA